jgi:hypothetical protein
MPLRGANGDRRDAIDARVLPYMSDDEQNATIEACIAGCSQFGYNAGGVEYGYQCCKYLNTVFGKTNAVDSSRRSRAHISWRILLNGIS